MGSGISREPHVRAEEESKLPPEAKRIYALARLLDDRFRLPGTNLRFGFDSLIGLIPGVGDVATSAVSLYLIHEARRLGVPKWMLLRMLAHTGIDFALGAVPLVGDLFDFGYKSNLKNARLLDEHLRDRS
jgi:hypothetical protein